MVDTIVDETRLRVHRNQIQRRVMDAVTSIHSSAFFEKDLQEDFVALGDCSNTSFQIPLPPRHRKFKAIQPMTLARTPMRTKHPNGRYMATTMSNVRNYYNEAETDYYYAAGRIINITARMPPQALYLAWYDTPEVADPMLETWIMREYPQMVMDWAIARFWKRNGKESIAAQIERTLYSVDLQNLINNNATQTEF